MWVNRANDCGVSARVHPKIAWARLRARFIVYRAIGPEAGGADCWRFWLRPCAQKMRRGLASTRNARSSLLYET
jgi:hypothetical protein